jgi:hypothetical protein
MAHLTLYDFRDIDLMMRIIETGDDEGWVSSTDLATALGMSDDVQSVAIRLSWMRRYGMLSWDEQKRMWRLSPGGERVTQAKLRAAAATQIDKVPDEAMVDVMAHVTARYRFGDPVVATLLRREFAYGTSPRSQAWDRNGSRRRR